MAHLSLNVRSDIARCIVDTISISVQARRVRFYCTSRVQHHWQDVILYLNKAQCLLGNFRRFSCNSRHTIAHKTHGIIQTILVLWTRVGPGLTSNAMWNTLHILIAQYRVHPWQCPRLRYINGANACMSMRAGQEASMQHVPSFDVIDENGFAGSQLDSINAVLRFTHNAQLPSPGYILAHAGIVDWRRRLTAQDCSSIHDGLDRFDIARAATQVA